MSELRELIERLEIAAEWARWNKGDRAVVQTADLFSSLNRLRQQAAHNERCEAECRDSMKDHPEVCAPQSPCSECPMQYMIGGAG